MLAVAKKHLENYQKLALRGAEVIKTLNQSPPGPEANRILSPVRAAAIALALAENGTIESKAAYITAAINAAYWLGKSENGNAKPKPK